MFTPMFHGQNRNNILLPIVTTLSMSSPYGTNTPTIILSLQITNEPTYSIVEQGFYYATHDNPGVYDNKVSSTFYIGSGIYNHGVIELDFITTYYARSFVKNSLGHITWGETFTANTITVCPVCELYFENVSRTNCDFGIKITKGYTELTVLNTTEIYVSTSNIIWGGDLTFTHVLAYIYPTTYRDGDLTTDKPLPYERLTNKVDGFLIPNTKYYFSVKNNWSTDFAYPGGLTPPYDQYGYFLGTGTFTTLP